MQLGCELSDAVRVKDICSVLARDGNNLMPLNLALRNKHAVCASFLVTKQWCKVRRPQLTALIPLFMAALRSGCGHYIFVLWFLLSFYSSPILSGRRLDVYHTAVCSKNLTLSCGQAR